MKNDQTITAITHSTPFLGDSILGNINDEVSRDFCRGFIDTYWDMCLYWDNPQSVPAIRG